MLISPLAFMKSTCFNVEYFRIQLGVEIWELLIRYNTMKRIFTPNIKNASTKRVLPTPNIKQAAPTN